MKQLGKKNRRKAKRSGKKGEFFPCVKICNNTLMYYKYCAVTWLLLI